MSDWVAETDLVHLVLDAVGLMDLSSFERSLRQARSRRTASRIVFKWYQPAGFVVGASMPSTTLDAHASATTER